MNHHKEEWKVQRPYIDMPYQIVTMDKDGRLKEKIATVDNEDNANLIAAAPDMYGALKSIAEEPNLGLPGHLLVKAFKARAKAEGGK